MVGTTVGSPSDEKYRRRRHRRRRLCRASSSSLIGSAWYSLPLLLLLRLLVVVPIVLLLCSLPLLGAAAATGRKDERNDNQATLHHHHRVLSKTPWSGRPTYVHGNLGTVRPSTGTGIGGGGGGGQGDERRYKQAAASALRTALSDTLSVTSERLEWHPIKVGRWDSSNDALVNPQQSHVRFSATIDGIPVVGAALVLHVDDSLQRAYALNGDFLSDVDLVATNSDSVLNCEDALIVALQDARFVNATHGVWRTDQCELTYVQAKDGQVHKAWSRTYAYSRPATIIGDDHGEDDRFAVDQLFASVTSGDLVAARPRLYGAGGEFPFLVETRNCGTNTTEPCPIVVDVNASIPIASGDAAIDAAHNYALDVLAFYQNEYNRTSIDNANLPIISNVHYDYLYFNAFWDGSINRIFYGDGDGVESRPLCLALDVVAHELTHGVTDYESNLYYYGESGAINEAMSDIFGATIEHVVKGKSVADTFRIAEDIYVSNNALRSMNDPEVYYDYDFYPDRYTGTEDEGGVHWNSGIMNLAFALMVTGGTHPRGKTNNVVPALDGNFTTSIKAAAAIFYHANTNCLTPNSVFADARLCTLQAADALYGSNSPQVASVAEAWTAVGVQDPTATTLRNGTPLMIAKLAKKQIIYYALKGCQTGETVTVQIRGSTGDTDLYTQWGVLPKVDDKVTACSSVSATSNEICKLTASSNKTLYILVQGYTAAADVSILARHYPPVLQVPSGGLASVTSLSSDTSGLIQDYQLRGIRVGDRVKCQIKGSNGDADLFVRFGSLAVTSTTFNQNACSSAKGSSSKEACTTAGAPKSTNASAAVYTTQPFTNATLGCSILPCAAIDKSCTASTCCASPDPRRKVVCDGIVGATTCKYCKAKGKACVRTTQCCSGRCSGTTKECL